VQKISGLPGPWPAAMPDQKVITMTCRPCRMASAYPIRL
jgi:hypothetical protein